MNAAAVVILPERLQLSLQIKLVPEKHAIEKLAAHRTDQTFHERMRNRHIRRPIQRALALPRVGIGSGGAATWAISQRRSGDMGDTIAGASMHGAFRVGDLSRG